VATCAAGDLQADPGHDLRRRSFDRFAGHDGAYGQDFRPGLSADRAKSGEERMGPMLTTGLLDKR